MLTRAIEDRKDDPMHARHVDKTDHGRGTAPYVREAAFDDVGGCAAFARGEAPGQRRRAARGRALSAERSTMPALMSDAGFQLIWRRKLGTVPTTTERLDQLDARQHLLHAKSHGRLLAVQ